MGLTNWDDLLFDTAERFGGQLPRSNEITAEIQAAHERAPHAVERTITEVAAEYEAGNIRSPWGILKARVENLHTPDTDRKAQGVNDRNKAIARAEQWIRVGGVHYDRETEITDEVFGDRGILRDHHTPELEQRIVGLWTELRPLGEKVEQDAIDFGLRYQQQQAELRKALKLSKQLADAGVGNLQPPVPSEPSPAVQALLDDTDGIPF